MGLNVIRGEVNIIRHIARILNDTFNYESAVSSESLRMDELLDQCYKKVVWGSRQDQLDVLSSYDALLGKSGHLCPYGRGELGLLDFVAWSALVGSGHEDAKQANVRKWIQSCKQLSGMMETTNDKRGGRHQNRNNKQSPGKENIKQQQHGNHNGGKRVRNKLKSLSKSPVKNVN